MSSSRNPNPPPCVEPDDVLAVRAYLAEHLRTEAHYAVADELEDRDANDDRLVRLTAACTRPGADGIAVFVLGRAASRWIRRFDADMTLDELLDLLIADEMKQQADELASDLGREGKR